MVKYLSFHNSSFALRCFFDVNGKAIVWHTPCCVGIRNAINPSSTQIPCWVIPRVVLWSHNKVPTKSESKGYQQKSDTRTTLVCTSVGRVSEPRGSPGYLYLNPDWHQFSHSLRKIIKNIETQVRSISFTREKLGKPSTLVVNWVSSCVSFFLRASSCCYIYFHCSYLYNYYNYSLTLCTNAEFQHFILRFN